MSQTLICTICDQLVSVSENALNQKVTCERCESLSRVKRDEQGNLYLHVLMENLDWRNATADEPQAEEAAAPEVETHEAVGPRLKTMRDKFREAVAEGESSNRSPKRSVTRSQRLRR